MLKRWLPFLIIASLAACTPAQDQLVFPEDVKVPYGEMNTAISLENLPVMENSMKNDEPFIIKIKNTTSSDVIFSKGYGIEIFSYKNSEWENIQNNFYYPEGNQQLPPSDVWPSGIIVSVVPKVLELKEPIDIFVFISGNINSPDGELVGAYYTYTLLPNEEFK